MMRPALSDNARRTAIEHFDQSMSQNFSAAISPRRNPVKAAIWKSKVLMLHANGKRCWNFSRSLGTVGIVKDGYLFLLMVRFWHPSRLTHGLLGYSNGRVSEVKVTGFIR